MAPTVTKKRSSHAMSIKHAAIIEVDKGAKKAHVAAKYGVSRGLLGDWIKNRADIFKAVSFGRVDIKREAPIHFPKTEAAVIKWLHTSRDGSVCISGPILICQALELNKAFPEESGFTGSDGWLTRVKYRHEIVARKLSGEANSVNTEVVTRFREEIASDLVTRYDVEDLYNCDEAGLNYNAASNMTLTFKGDNGKGTKQDRRRITLLFCTNMTGSDKRKILVIGYAQNPRGMGRHRKRPVPYKWNKKAWMTSIFFEEWLNEWNAELSKVGRKIALVLDNAPCHPKLTLSNIELVFLPPNTTSHLQPLDQGIIANFKVKYRTMYTTKHLCPAVHTGKQPGKLPMYEALQFCKAAWGMVTPRTISRCFRKGGFLNPAVEVSTPETEEEDNLPLSELALRLTEAGRPHTEADIEAALTEDEQLQPWGFLTNEEITEEVEEGLRVNPEEDDVEEDESCPQLSLKPTLNEFRGSFDVVEQFLSYEDGPQSDEMYSLIQRLKTILLTNPRNQKQTNIKDYFG